MNMLKVVEVSLVSITIFLSVVFLKQSVEIPSTSGDTFFGEILYEERTRTWITYLPEELAEPAPVVFVLHGSGETAQDMRQATNYRFDELANRDGFIVVYAEGWVDGGLIGPEWNECRKNTALPAHIEDVDDVGFIKEILGRLEHKYPVDPLRVYAAGFSDGGQMSYRLATELADRFAAVAVISAQQVTIENSNCKNPKGPISILVMNGTEDPMIPYEGGEACFHGMTFLGTAGQVQSMTGTTQYWKTVNGIDGDGITEQLPNVDPDDGSTVKRETWQSDTGHEVVVYSVLGGGHTIPGGNSRAPEFISGSTNRDILAVDEIWGFFKRNPLRP